MFKAILQAIFGSLWDRFFPPQTAADVKAKQAQDNVVILQAEAKAAADAPTDMEQLIKEQQEGKI